MRCKPYSLSSQEIHVDSGPEHDATKRGGEDSDEHRFFFWARGGVRGRLPLVGCPAEVEPRAMLEHQRSRLTVALARDDDEWRHEP